MTARRLVRVRVRARVRARVRVRVRVGVGVRVRVVTAIGEEDVGVSVARLHGDIEALGCVGEAVAEVAPAPRLEGIALRLVRVRVRMPHLVRVRVGVGVRVRVRVAHLVSVRVGVRVRVRVRVAHLVRVRRRRSGVTGKPE